MRTKKIFTFGFAIYFAAVGAFMFLEPELTRAALDTVAVSVEVTTEITVDCDTSATLTGSGINAITGGNATGSFSCTVTTPDTKGYSLKVKENHTLQNGGGATDTEFTDYVPSGAGGTMTYDYGTVASPLESCGFLLD
jgi:hypothetical protein